jgi:hypothetical protein
MVLHQCGVCQISIKALYPVIETDTSFQNFHCRCSACNNWNTKT